MFLRPCMTALALAVAAAGAQAQSNDQAQTGQQSSANQAQTNQAQTNNNQSQAGTNDQAAIEVIAISAWDYEPLYERGGIRAENILDADVFGPTGEEIGEIENIIIDDSNQIVAVIAEVGGFWDIGDTHIAVPWEEVTLTGEGVQIPVTEDTADDYGLFGPNSFVTKADLQQTTQVDDDLETGMRTWKITNLIDDYATLTGGVGYGYVDDVLFSRDGEIEAVVVESTGTYGPGTFAYPFYGYDYGWNPGFDAYELPYEEADLVELETFDYEEFDS